MSIIQEIQQHKFHVVSCLLCVYLYIVSLGFVSNDLVFESSLTMLNENPKYV